MNSGTEDRLLRTAYLAVGDEIVSGRIVDTNLSVLTSCAAGLEQRVVNMHCADRLQQIQAALEFAANLDVDLIVISGGLGPTQDDLTREAVAAFSGCPLEWRNDAWSHVQRVFAERGIAVIPESNRRQGFLPKGARLLDNPLGTACGLVIECGFTKGPCHLLCLPGVPCEFEALLRAYFGAWRATAGEHADRGQGGDEWLIAGLGESAFEDQLMALLPQNALQSYAICARAGLLEVKMSWRENSRAAQNRQMVDDRFAPFLVSHRIAPLAEQLVGSLRARDQALFVVDRVTAGLLLEDPT